MKNIKYKISTISLIAILMLFNSCDDFLEESLSTDIDADFVLDSEVGLESGIIGLYNFNRETYLSNSSNSVIPLMMLSRGDLTLPRSGEIALFGRYQWGVSITGPDANILAVYWKLYYKIASRATSIIDAAENIENIDEDNRKRIIAEAKFFRANSYFILYRMFNNIFVTEIPTTPENAFDIVEDKSSEQEVFDLLKRDLDYAIENLQWTTGDFGRVTKGTAKHLRAKVAMWQGDWNEAKAQSESLIDEGPHSLHPSTATLFDDDMNHSEQLFTIQFAIDVNGGGNRTRVNWNLIPWYYVMSGSTRREEYGGRGFAFLIPNNYLLNHFTDPALGGDPNDNRTNNTYFRMQYFYNDEATLPSGVNLGDLIDIYEPNTPSNPNSSTNARYYRHIHPSCLKYKEEGSDPAVSEKISNVMVYRLAETYLIAAEANMRLGADGTALGYLNAVRNRANAGSLSTINQQAILEERARELSFEGQRFYTLKRMGVLSNQIRTYAGDDLYHNEARQNFEDHYINFPIPQSQIDLLGVSYPQNDGF